jgi:hypothetical protein
MKKAGQDIKEQASNIAYNAGLGINAQQPAETSMDLTKGYPEGTPANFPQPMSKEQFIKTYDVPKQGIDNEYAAYTKAFRLNVLSTYSYLDENNNEAYRNYDGLPIDMKRTLGKDVNNKDAVAYKSTASRPVDDLNPDTGLEEPNKKWLITSEQLNNIIYDAKNGAFNDTPAPETQPQNLDQIKQVQQSQGMPQQNVGTGTDLNAMQRVLTQPNPGVMTPAQSVQYGSPAAPTPQTPLTPNQTIGLGAMASVLNTYRQAQQNPLSPKNIFGR